jgi:rhodanese-related sulfurtransferase
VKPFLRNLAGGLLIMVVAAVLGIIHNSVRGSSIPLIQKVGAVSTVGQSVGEDEASGALDDTTGPAAAPTTQGEVGGVAVPEGSVTMEELRKMMEEGAVTVIDARAADVYAEGHIAGAINIPYDRLPEYYERLTELGPVDAAIVCYCFGPSCDFSDQLATELRIMGYTNVRVFTGGWEYWQKAGYPVERTKVD